MLRPGCSRELKRNNISITITVLSVIVMLLSFAASCTGGKSDLADAITARDSLPSLVTRGGESLISDSGITRYRILAEEWAVFDKRNPSYWAFEKGAYLEQFDSLFQVAATIESDTAYYFDESGLWELIGNVHIENVEGEKFDTDLLYWNSKEEKIYTDAFIRIEQIDRIVFGDGFDSNQQMTVYTIRNIKGEFYFDDMGPPPPPEVDSLGNVQVDPPNLSIIPDTLQLTTIVEESTPIIDAVTEEINSIVTSTDSIQQ